MTNLFYIIYELNLKEFENLPLKQARAKIKSDLDSLNRPVLIKIPLNYMENFQTYKALLPYVLTLTNPDVKIVSDQDSFERCKLYSNGSLKGDPKSGYYVST
ncbi:hypothetical protein DRZ77_02275 [Candidatus Woesearchaeota archaeon]|nr:MAG: hypothetical protein DRZ77_02275 [Candidatus Woesearchaeota archaeon]